MQPKSNISKKNIQLPPALTSGTVNDQDIRFINIGSESIIFESQDILEDNMECIIDIFNFDERIYNNFVLKECKIINNTKEDFSYIYEIRIFFTSSDDKSKFNQLVNKIHQFIESRNKYGSVEKVISNGFLNENHTPYPSHKENIFFDNIKDQKQEWYHSIKEAVNQKEFSSIFSNIDLAFNINSQDLYNQFNEIDFIDAISINIKKDIPGIHELTVDKFSRVYIGNEYCPHNFPPKDILFKLMDKAHSSNYSITLSFSYVFDRDTPNIIELLDDIEKWCIKNKEKVEILVNDWGMVEILGRYTNLQAILGRLLNRRKKDPRKKWFWGYKDYSKKFKF